MDRLQDTGISVLHSIFPFSHFWWPEIVPDGFSVMILYLRQTDTSVSLTFSPVLDPLGVWIRIRLSYMTSLFLRGPSNGRKGRLPVAAW